VRFEGGRIVDVQAGSGAEVVRAQLATDDQAPCLSEVALVDGSSPVRQTGLVFSDTLFDENATCHIAYGMGIPPETLGQSPSPDELLEAGTTSRRSTRIS
jgi:aminopeptidase